MAAEAVAEQRHQIEVLGRRTDWEHVLALKTEHDEGNVVIISPGRWVSSFGIQQRITVSFPADIDPGLELVFGRWAASVS